MAAAAAVVVVVAVAAPVNTNVSIVVVATSVDGVAGVVAAVEAAVVVMPVQAHNVLNV